MKKQAITILSFLIFVSSNISSQDIGKIFKLLPMPYEWINDEIKDRLLDKKSVDYNDLVSLGLDNRVSSFSTVELTIDKRNGYLCLADHPVQLELCCWKCSDSYLVAMAQTTFDTNGDATDWVDFYTVYPDGRYYIHPSHLQSYPLPTVSDFFKDNATKKDIEDSYACLVFKLPQKGKNITVHCVLGDGDSYAERSRKARPLMKGNTMEVIFDGSFFNKGNVYYMEDIY